VGTNRLLASGVKRKKNKSGGRLGREGERRKWRKMSKRPLAFRRGKRRKDWGGGKGANFHLQLL